MGLRIQKKERPKQVVQIMEVGLAVSASPEKMKMIIAKSYRSINDLPPIN